MYAPFRLDTESGHATSLRLTVPSPESALLVRHAAVAEAARLGFSVPPVASPGELFPWGFTTSKWTRSIVPNEPPAYAVETGEPIRWDQERFKGKIVIIDVSASWCGGCMSVVRPELLRLTESDGKRIEVISVNFLDRGGSALKLQTSEPASWLPVTIDNEKWADVWGQARVGRASYGIPDVMIVDQQGRLVIEIQGAQPGVITKTVRALIDMPSDPHPPEKAPSNDRPLANSSPSKP